MQGAIHGIQVHTLQPGALQPSKACCQRTASTTSPLHTQPQAGQKPWPTRTRHPHQPYAGQQTTTLAACTGRVAQSVQLYRLILGSKRRVVGSAEASKSSLRHVNLTAVLQAARTLHNTLRQGLATPCLIQLREPTDGWLIWHTPQPDTIPCIKTQHAHA
jgi:hypothetical protein